MDDQDDTTLDTGEEPIVAEAAEGREDGIVVDVIEEDPSTIIEVELDLADLDEVPVVDDSETAQRDRRFRWTPGLGMSTKPAIRVGVMLGGKRGVGDKS